MSSSSSANLTRSELEVERDSNIQRNKEYLEKLGLSKYDMIDALLTSITKIS